jgi:hypothetical protein
MNLTEIREESHCRVNQITHLGAEIDRLNGELARVNEVTEAKTSHILHIEQVSAERGAEIERLNQEIDRLYKECGAKTSEVTRQEQVTAEQSAEIERLHVELSEKSVMLDRYIYESAQMAIIIMEAQDERDEWRRMSVTAEIEEVIRGTAHETGEHQHINYTLRGITHLGRKFSSLDVRIIEHRGNPGIVIFEPLVEERVIYAWERHGEENGRPFMIIIPSKIKNKEWLVRATTNDLLLIKDIIYYTNKKYEQEGRNGKWSIVFNELKSQINNLDFRLHYDDVILISKNKTTCIAEVANLSISGILLKNTIFEIEKGNLKRIMIDGQNIILNLQHKNYLIFNSFADEFKNFKKILDRKNQ